MIELFVIIAIISVLAALLAPRIAWEEPPRRVLQRALIEAVDTARSGASIRFRIDREGNIGTIIPEILVRDEENEFGRRTEATWQPLRMRWEPTGNTWVFDPEIIYFFQDGMSTPARITWGNFPDEENFLLTVTGYLVEHNRF